MAITINDIYSVLKKEMFLIKKYGNKKYMIIYSMNVTIAGKLEKDIIIAITRLHIGRYKNNLVNIAEVNLNITNKISASVQIISKN